MRLGRLRKDFFIPSCEEGWLRPLNKMSRYLKQGAAGEVRLTSPAAPILR
jgi:hypothetical protein